jgi:steroid delta-isomerase-like uncharacterized protein
MVECRVTADDTRELVRRYFRLLGGGPVADADSLLADDFVFCHPLLTPVEGVRGRDVFLAKVLGPTRHALADMSFAVHDVVVEGDRAAARWTVSATHAETYMGVAPTGRSVHVSGINIFYMANGRISATWVARDNLELLRQLGGLS